MDVETLLGKRVTTRTYAAAARAVHEAQARKALLEAVSEKQPSTKRCPFGRAPLEDIAVNRHAHGRADGASLCLDSGCMA